MNSVSIYRRSGRFTAAHEEIFITDRTAALRGTMPWRVIMIDIDSISPNPSQPRKNFEGEAMARLADSIRCYGILQPITVRRRQSSGTADGSDLSRRLSERDITVRSDGDDGEIYISDLLYTVPGDGAEYELVAGGRRLCAARLAGLKQIPCIVADTDDRGSAELSIIENLQHETLNIFEQASAIASLIDVYSLTQEEAAHRLSTSQSYVANKLRILRLTEPERRLILENGLSERHARTLLRLTTPEERISALNVMIAEGMNVAASEQYIDSVLKMHEDAKQSVKRKFVLKDIRLLYNTIDRAVESVRGTGIAVSTARRETEDAYEMVIEVAKCR